MTKIYKFKINHDPILRGASGSQIQPYQDEPGMKELYEFFIYENNFYSNIGSRIPFEFKLEAKLKQDAKLTDILHQGHINAPIGLVVSKNFKNFLSGYNPIPCHWYHMKIRDDKNEYIKEEYYWMYPFRLVEEIDFERTSKESNSIIEYSDESEFIELRRQSKSMIAEIERKYIFNNPDKFYKLQAIVQSVGPNKIFLKERGIQQRYDFFGFKYDTNWYISEKLKTGLESSNLTGFEIGNLTANDVIEFE